MEFKNGLVFFKVVDSLGKYKDAHYISCLFIKVIEEVGFVSCVQIIIDNYAICKVFNLIVETKYLQIFLTAYIVHSLNFSLKCICLDVAWIGNYNDAHHTRNYV